MLKNCIIVACGAFSPITYGHLRMFEMAKDKLQSLGFKVHKGILSPVSDHYWKKGLLSSFHRVNMCRNGVKDSDWIECDEWESKQDRFTPTVDVLQHFQDENGKDTQVFFLGGADLVNSFTHPEWWTVQEVEKMTNFFTTVVIERKEFPLLQHPLIEEINDRLIHIPQEVQNDISSTKLRRLISEGRSIKYLTSDAVIDYIKEHKLYI
jgi:nicotinamide mononucleotide adenylyltransferase